MFTINDLPPEALQMIFLYLGLREVAASRCVCVLWFNLLNTEMFSKAFIKNHYAHLLGTEQDERKETCMGMMDNLMRFPLCPEVQFRLGATSENSVAYIAVSRNGRLAAFAMESGFVQVWDLDGNREICRHDAKGKYEWDNFAADEQVLDFNRTGESLIVACNGHRGEGNIGIPSLIIYEGSAFQKEYLHHQLHPTNGCIVKWSESRADTFYLAENGIEGMLIISEGKFSVERKIETKLLFLNYGFIFCNLLALYFVDENTLVLKHKYDHDDEHIMISTYHKYPYFFRRTRYLKFPSTKYPSTQITRNSVCHSEVVYIHKKAIAQPDVDLGDGIFLVSDPEPNSKLITPTEIAGWTSGDECLDSHRPFCVNSEPRTSFEIETTLLRGRVHFAIHECDVIGFNPMMPDLLVLHSRIRGHVRIYKSPRLLFGAGQRKTKFAREPSFPCSSSGGSFKTLL